MVSQAVPHTSNPSTQEAEAGKSPAGLNYETLSQKKGVGAHTWKLSVLSQDFDPSTWDAEMGRSRSSGSSSATLEFYETVYQLYQQQVVHGSMLGRS